MTPAISVIIPCYNGEAYLAQAIDSALAQSYPAHEIIVVDDGSTDDSAKVAESYGSAVRLVHQENRGEAGARNGGAAVATGTHYLFLDADDLLTPDALARLASAARTNPEALIVMQFVSFADDPTRPTTEPLQLPESLFPDMIRTCIGVPHTWLTPASLYRRTSGFTPTRNYFVDWEFWCRLAVMHPPYVPLQFVGALYRRHAQTMSANTPPEKRVRGHIAVMETLTTGLLQRPDLLEQHGVQLFWGTWNALDRALKNGVAWRDLERLESAMVAIAQKGPSMLRNSAFARAVRWLGVKRAYSLRARLRREPIEGPTDVAELKRISA